VDDDFTSDDIRQMAAEGDLRAFMRSRMRTTTSTNQIPPAAPPTSRQDGRPVGSWPLGSYLPGGPLPGDPDYDPPTA
jgi:hypothetical protein